MIFVYPNGDNKLLRCCDLKILMSLYAPLIVLGIFRFFAICCCLILNARARSYIFYKY
jgi:hypothetical protein